MSERKVLNKYYPPDFDPTKIPKLKRPKNRQFNIRIMAPFNMRCGTCGEYIYKGKKFNSRQEKVEDEDYLGLMIFRFYIKCPLCVAEITFKTDPQNTDYELEAGAIRNFEALRTAEILAEKEQKEKEEDEKNNPMKVLENRTKASRQEMEMLETLEELREMNSRNAKVDTEHMLALHSAYERNLARLQVEEDEAFIKSVFGKPESGTVKRVHDEEGDDDVATTSAKVPRTNKPSDILTQGSTYEETLPASNSATKQSTTATKSVPVWQKSVGGLGSKKGLAGLVKKRTPAGGAGTKAGGSATIAGTKLDSSSTVTGAVSGTLTAKVCGVSENDQAVSSIPLPPQPQACKVQPGGSTTEPEASKSNGTPKPSLPQPPNSKATEQGMNTETKTIGNHGASLAPSSQDGSTSLLGGSTAPVVAKPLGLGLLGAYSDTDSSDGDST